MLGSEIDKLPKIGGDVVDVAEGDPKTEVVLVKAVTRAEVTCVEGEDVPKTVDCVEARADPKLELLNKEVESALTAAPKIFAVGLTSGEQNFSP